ncbi:MAG: type II secretion system protein M [Thermoguttaceae bacterium]|jgi:Tfp pilus assembly protein PilO|nr:type II secretion system protein M [Thermoguttaceae bacterium]
MDAKEAKTTARSLAEQFRDPNRLRVLASVVMLAVGYLGIYLPLASHLDETSRALQKERQRQALFTETDCLRLQAERFADRVPAGTDNNEWIQYVLQGVRKYPLKMTALDAGSSERLGPYQAVQLTVELEGNYSDLDAFLAWLETNRRLFRVDSAKIAPAKGDEGRLVMQLTLWGLRS